MSAIEKWLNDFCTEWKAKNVDEVMNLFTEDVEYWETPHKRIETKEQLFIEWGAILEQENLVISTTVFASCGNKHSVIWGIAYQKSGIQSVWAGTYLIELNKDNKCSYFMQTGEKK